MAKERNRIKNTLTVKESLAAAGIVYGSDAVIDFTFNVIFSDIIEESKHRCKRFTIDEIIRYCDTLGVLDEIVHSYDLSSISIGNTLLIQI